jgi:hypothetical protein
MPVKDPDPMSRLVVSYDTDRLDDIEAAGKRLSDFNQTSVTFAGGPLDGRERLFRIIPDEMYLEDVDGWHYVPHMTEPTYHWMPITE